MKNKLRTMSIAVLFSLSSCSYINQQLGLLDDNDGEEIIEEVIKGHTGIDIDLTPSTKERKV